MSRDPWVGLADLLSRLEDLELHLLSWGVVDGHLSRDDVDRAIDVQLEADVRRDPELVVPTLDEYRESLVEQGLLHEIPGTDKYRTRLAETLRLLRTLRQLWPPANESQPGWWRHYNTLVSDYRLRVSPRRYPARLIPVDNVVATLGQLDRWSDVKAGVVRRMIRDDKLARFQVEATRSILTSLAHPQPAATIVTAGTGSGKTRAFYLPALIDIADRADEKRTGPHTLALYPRNELLRDQARESVRVIEAIGPLAGPGTRRGRIAMLYGNTPREKELNSNAEVVKNWRRVSDGWQTPYFPCLDDKCMNVLVWADADRIGKIERLTCPKCGAVTTDGVVAMTRESLKANPPDILFSSTEMLSKQSTSWDLAQVLGWKGGSGTRLVLLDEVHTYAGVAGAQVALMLRRWRYANRKQGQPSPVFVGLSATLRDAGDFMSTLTGVERAHVDAIAPSSVDMLPTSREYGLVLRGDPVSGAQLLSTTIQAAMLISRVLDNQAGIFGSVAFAFTDDLDVINRLHDNLRDAEGHDPYGMAGGRVLADLRSPAADQAGARYPEGQSWNLPQRIGRMDRQMRIARTTSQDTGVDSAADVIVATSSLEVGFNDPRVGAVIQHKAPRDMASFLQRRGRAGRKLEMRPITAVVLSDYGRDRITYQSYERLLDPEIAARNLPVGNRFVLKIQATHALLDWIHRRTGADARWVMSAPLTGQINNRTDEVATLLARVLADADMQRELTMHLRWALQITEDEASAVLWEEPRSLLLSVLPTALRRLESKWVPAGDDDPGAEETDPLPEFMTGALFDSLNAPDVTFYLPFKDSKLENMPIAAALREAVPGRVSRRFGHARSDYSTWLPVPREGDELALTTVVARGHNLGTWTVGHDEYRVVRPLALKLAKPDRGVSTNSQAFPVWKSAFGYVKDTLVEVDVPRPSVWSRFVDGIGFGLHVTGGPMQVRRLTIGSEGELIVTEGRKTSRRPVSVRYAHAGEAAALGYELDVDGLVVAGRLAELDGDLRTYAASPAWRTAAYRQLVLEDERLDSIANSFQRSWLVEVYKHAYVSFGLENVDLTSAPAALADGAWAQDMSAFFAASYRADQGGIEGSRLLTTLSELSALPIVRTVLEEHGRVLVESDPVPRTAGLLDRVFADTLGSAILTAVQECVPDAQENDLAVDIEFDAATRGFRIFITETSIGGLGLLESLHREYCQDPRIFWDAVGRACSTTEAEDVDSALQALLADLVSTNSIYGAAVAAFRDAADVTAMDAALDALVEQWTEHDGPPPHLLVSSFAARFLRPGSKKTIDDIAAKLVFTWVELEDRLGVEIDARTLVHHAAKGRLGFDLGPLGPDMAFSMLWLRGAEARAQRVQHWHPFRRDVLVDRLALAGSLNEGLAVIDVTKGAWLDDYVAAIEQDGRTQLEAPYRERTTIADALRSVAVTPTDRGGLRVFGRVTALSQARGYFRATISLAEELQ